MPQAELSERLLSIFQTYVLVDCINSHSPRSKEVLLVPIDHPVLSPPLRSDPLINLPLPSLSILVDRRGALGKQGDNQPDGNEWIGRMTEGGVGESLCGTDLGKALFLEPPLIDGTFHF